MDATARAPELVDLRDHPDEQLLASIHDGLYTRSFPRAEEREDLATLRAGLWGDERDRPPICHFVVARSPEGAVLGLAACEYYPRSCCGLLSYVAVEPAARGTGIARDLLGFCVERLDSDAAAAGDTLAAVFGEIHDPAKSAAANDSIPPLERVRIMSRLGARRVPIAYVQPELAPGRGRGRDLMLVAFPIGEPGHVGHRTASRHRRGLRRARHVRTQPRDAVESLDSAVVRGFLEELYETLGVARPLEDVDFARSLLGLRDETVDLEELASVEKPLLDPATVYGIAIHLAVDPRHFGEGSDADVRSFEDDMLAYAYQGDGTPRPAPDVDDPPTGHHVPVEGAPPFATRTIEVDDRLARLAVEFPGEVTYLSEGRRVSLRCEPPGGRTRRFLLRAARTDFNRSGLSVLHLVLGPDPSAQDTSSLNEYDVIKLMKLWQASEGLSTDGEDADGKPFVRIRAGGCDLTLLDLAREVFGEVVDPKSPRVGTVQILHEICRHGLCDEIVQVREHPGAPPRGGAPLSANVIAVGGLVQGLLDFQAIDRAELADVFREVELEEELARAFHKGTLIVVSSADRAFSAESIQRSLGLSPYLLVPHAVLLHNDWCLWRSVRALDDTRGPGVPGFRHLPGLGKLGKQERARRAVARTMSQYLVPNVFHYTEERNLYEVGRRSRGLDRRQRSVEGRLAAITADIRARHARIRSGATQSLPLLLLVFTWLDALNKYKSHRDLVIAVLVPVTLLTLAGLAFVFWRDD